MPTKEELRSRFNDLQRKVEHLGRGGDRLSAEKSSRSVNGKDINAEIRSAQKEMRAILNVEDRLNKKIYVNPKRV